MKLDKISRKYRKPNSAMYKIIIHDQMRFILGTQDWFNVLKIHQYSPLYKQAKKKICHLSMRVKDSYQSC